MKTILLPIYWDQALAARLNVATELASSIGAHLVCVYAEPADVQARSLGCVLTETTDRYLRVTADLRACVEQHLADHDVSRSWLRIDSFDVVTLSRVARLCDLLVMPSTWAISEPASPRPAEVVTRVSVPVLAVPLDAKPLPARHRVVVGWDGSEAAATALRGAVPVLQTAETVTLLSIGDDRPKTLIDPTDYLAWHGVSADAAQIAARGSICETLCEEVASREANLLIMGAYGWGRWAEELFGGVTESMLERTRVPVLLGR